jgi:hypothetical protein
MVRSRIELGCVALSLLALTACGGAPGDGADVANLGVASAALSTNESVLGFESAQDWSASAGTLSSTSVHTQGSAALNVSSNGYTELTSAPLSTLATVSATVSVDIRPSISPTWGSVQLVLDAPSRGLYSAYVGQASLQNLPANTFSRLDFTLSSQAQQALAGSYSDLRFKLAINAPQAAIVLDNLRFQGQNPPDCAAGSAYTLTIGNAAGIPTSTVEGIRCTFYQVYPELAADYNPSAQTTVPLTFVEEEPNMPPAWASSGGLYINKGYILRNPQDWDVIVHEGMHIVQQGYTGTVPGWIIEGTADFVRDKYGLTNDLNGWSIVTGYAYGQHYTSGYGIAAAFFKWIDAHHRVGQTSVTQALDDILRAGTYSDAQTWTSLTGLGLDALWSAYSGGLAPAPATQGVIVYEHAGFDGRGVKLDRGNYALIDLQARGVQNDWISSVAVPAGYRLRAFTDDNFSGVETVYTADETFVGAQNDLFSSLIVE